jgi:hypothetical protein
MTNSMKQSSSWEANSHLANQKILHLLWNPILSQVNPVHTLQDSFFKIHLILSSHLG